MRHEYRELTEDEQKAVDTIKDFGKEFTDMVERLGDNRAFSLAKTKMEEAVMWAVKGVAAP